MKQSIKKYSSVLLLVQGMLFFQGCDKNFEEINTNPDAISSPTPQYIFTKALYDGANYSGNTETLLLGNVAIRTGDKMTWDRGTMKANNSDTAQNLIRPERRTGWEL